MHNFPRKALRIYRPRYLRPAIDRDDDSFRKYPTPAELFSRIGAVILIALCVGLAGDFLANALISLTAGLVACVLC
jgi:hypothetical protein